jgi:hypothetical protein
MIVADELEMKTRKSKRGGARPGAGRKRKRPLDTREVLERIAGNSLERGSTRVNACRELNKMNREEAPRRTDEPIEDRITARAIANLAATSSRMN